ncbi:MAG: adenylosuccinate lyase [Chlamydiota bacterium]|nr:adenylosuccinate lyase [Chlamydiota bacterium]
MIERYTTEEMKQLWSEENKMARWLDVELYAVEALYRLNIIPKKDYQNIKKGAAFQIKQIAGHEKELQHDVIAFLTNLTENVGPSGRFIHYGMTSSDVLDTSLAVLMVQAMDYIIPELALLMKSVKKLALRHKYTPMIGRSHGVHAEPISFGLKLALYWDELKRAKEHLLQARETIGYGKISGAVGTFAHIDPSVEAYVCRQLRLKPAPVSSQVIQRDRHAYYLSSIAIAGAVLEQIAAEIRNLQRTETLEVQEGFGEKQKGSSAMPHKRNPINAEKICGLARVLRSNLIAAIENVALWHERDITHSSVERIIIPDSTTLLHYMIRVMRELMDKLVVLPKNMIKNMEISGGIIYSQRILLELVKHGLSREDAYRQVQRCAHKAWDSGKSFKEILLADEELKKWIKVEAIHKAFDVKYHFKNIDRVFKRVGL